MTWSIVSAYLRQLERERGAIVKDWGGRIPVALVFPQTYHAGMSNLGFQSMYALFNTWPDVVCERVFLPDPDLAAEYARTDTPLLSMETQRPVRDFEIVAFSISYEKRLSGGDKGPEPGADSGPAARPAARGAPSSWPVESR